MQNKLDNLESIKTIDKSNMSEFIKELPDQIAIGLKIAENKKLIEKYKNLKNAVLVGMGGSASACDLLLSQPLENFTKPITLVRDSVVPGWVDKKTLVVLISHSGQTKETLSAFKQSASLEAEIIIVAERGALEKFGSMENAFVYDYNTHAVSRASLGFQLGILVGLFNQLDFFSKVDLLNAIHALKDFNQELIPEIKTEKNLAKHLAFRLFDRKPIIISSTILKAVATRFKNQLNENSKTYSSTEIIPEAMHNSLEGLSFPARAKDDNFYILARSVFDSPQNLQAIDYWAGVLETEQIEYEIVEGRGDDLWTENLSLILLMDWVSFYLAILNNTDPTLVENIEKFKLDKF